LNKYLIECELEFFSSHGIHEVGFSGGSEYHLEEGMVSKCPLGLPNTEIEIASTNAAVFKVKIESFDLLEQDIQVQYIKKLASYLSFLSAKNEHNGHYGTPYIDINYKTFIAKSVVVEEHTVLDNKLELQSFLNMTDSLSITSTCSIKFNKNNVVNIKHNDLLNYYYNGLKAESEKSKFFHWFLIVESLEVCSRYSQMFPSSTMFTEEEQGRITDLANNLSNDKKNILLSVLTRTSAFRNNKLYELLHSLGIQELKSMQSSKELSIDVIKSITKARNKLFHKGNEFPTNILWFALFPLVTKIVEKTITDPLCLESS
jgi:hypothetical protein